MDFVKIKELIKKGDEAQEQKKYEEALYFYGEALQLVPEPFLDQDTSRGILKAIGDSYFLMKNYERATEAFRDALMCPRGGADPYIRLKLGQIAFDQGDKRTASSELACAYLNGGKEVFDSEDRKYLEFVEPLLE